MSATALRGFSAAGAALLLIGIASLIIGVVTWWPLVAPPEVWVYATGFVIVAGLVVTIMASTTLARRR